VQEASQRLTSITLGLPGHAGIRRTIEAIKSSGAQIRNRHFDVSRRQDLYHPDTEATSGDYFEPGSDPPSTTIAGWSLVGSKREARIASALSPKIIACPGGPHLMTGVRDFNQIGWLPTHL
jgi:hypothetical protein